MTENLIKILVLAYAIILIVALIERKWPLALYWAGATILQIAVLWMAAGSAK